MLSPQAFQPSHKLRAQSPTGLRCVAEHIISAGRLSFKQIKKHKSRRLCIHATIDMPVHACRPRGPVSQEASIWPARMGDVDFGIPALGWCGTDWMDRRTAIIAAPIQNLVNRKVFEVLFPECEDFALRT